MVELPKIGKARLFNPNHELEIVAVELFYVNGRVHIEGIPLQNEFVKRQQFEEFLGFKVSGGEKDWELTLVGKGSGLKQVKVTGLISKTIGPLDDKVELICYGMIEVFSHPLDKNQKKLVLGNIVFEGIDLCYNKATTKSTKRFIDGKEEDRPESMAFDYTETRLIVREDPELLIDTPVILTRIDNSSLRMTISEGELLTVETYSKIKSSLESFLSFGVQSDVRIREEYFWCGHHFVQRIYSFDEKVYMRSRETIEFIPITELQFRNKDVINKYFECFNRFHRISKKLDLHVMISLLVHTNGLYIDARFYILIVALEAFSKELIDLLPSDKRNTMYIEDSTFKEAFESVLNEFEKKFAFLKKAKEHTKYNQLYQKMISLNTKNKTASKFTIMLKLCEVRETDKVIKLFDTYRHLAIHSGKIGHGSEEQIENFRELDKLVKIIIANLMQYKGIRWHSIEEDGTWSYWIEEEFSGKIDNIIFSS